MNENNVEEKSGGITSKTWFAWLMLLMVFPFGLFLFWKHKHYSPLVRSLITVFCVLLLILQTLAVGTTPTSKKEVPAATAAKTVNQDGNQTGKKTVPPPTDNKREIDQKNAEVFYQAAIEQMKLSNKSIVDGKSEDIKRYRKNSLECINQAIALDPKNFKYLYYKFFPVNFVSTVSENERFELANTILKECSDDLNAENKYFIYDTLSEIYRKNRDYGAALDNIEKALAAIGQVIDKIEILDKDNKKTFTADLYIEKGNIYNDLKQYNQAMACYKQAADTSDSFKQLPRTMADFYKIRGKPAAMLKYRKAILWSADASDKKSFIHDELESLGDAYSDRIPYVDYNFPAIHSIFVVWGRIDGLYEKASQYIEK